MVKDTKIQYVKVQTKSEYVAFMRDEEIRAIELKSEFVLNDTLLLDRISRDTSSPRLLDVLCNQIYEDDIFHDVEDLEWDDVEEVVVRVVKDGMVYYKQSVDTVILYDLGEMLGLTRPWELDIDELYVPDLYDLEEAYDRLKIFEDVLSEINWRESHKYTGYNKLYNAIIEDEIYGYVKRYCDGHYF